MSASMNDIGDVTIFLGGLITGIPQVASRAKLRRLGRSITQFARERFRTSRDDLVYVPPDTEYIVIAREKDPPPFTEGRSSDLDLSVLILSVVIIIVLFVLFIVFVTAMHGGPDSGRVNAFLYYSRLLAYVILVFLSGYLVSQGLGLLLVFLTWSSYGLMSAKNRIVFVSANTMYHFLRRSTLYLVGGNYQRKFTTLGLVVTGIGVAINILSRHI